MFRRSTLFAAADWIGVPRSITVARTTCAGDGRHWLLVKVPMAVYREMTPINQGAAPLYRKLVQASKTGQGELDIASCIEPWDPELSTPARVMQTALALEQQGWLHREVDVADEAERWTPLGRERPRGESPPDDQVLPPPDEP